MVRQRALSIVLIFLTVSSFFSVEAGIWQDVKKFFDSCVQEDDQLTFSEYLKKNFKSAIKSSVSSLPLATLTVLGMWVKLKLLHRNDPYIEAYNTEVVRSERQRFLRTVEEKLHTQKEELDQEWEQIQNDKMQLEALQKELGERLAGQRAGLVGFIQEKIFKKQVNKPSSTDLQQLKSDTKRLEDFVNSKEQDHMKRREQLANMIDAYNDQYLKFIETDPSKAA